MDYIEVIINYRNDQKDLSEIFIAELSVFDFDSFAESEGKIKAYIPAQKFNENDFLVFFKNNTLFSSADYTINTIGDKNWNEVWERNFDPVLIDGQCFIRAPFHAPNKQVMYELVIEPKMSFGTGHHASTMLMIRQMLLMDFAGKQVLDMGCGTGVLAILASKKGAASVTAIDNFHWAVKNTEENIKINNTKNIDVLHGDALLLKNSTFDVILANINKNVLLEDMKVYKESLNPGGVLMMSGIMEKDAQDIVNRAFDTGLKPAFEKTKGDWVLLSCNIA